MITIVILIVLIIVVSALLFVVGFGVWEFYKDHTSVMLYGTFLMETGDCDRCDHPFGAHVFFNRSGNPYDGGKMFCPVDECDCKSTWSVQHESQQHSVG